jgi:hypothetical protein
MTEFIAGDAPKPATSQWNGNVLTGTNWTIQIPTNMPLGEYEILVGLFDPKNRNARQRLVGDEDARCRYCIGTLIVKADDIGLVKPAESFVPSARWLANKSPVDFGVATTDGAFRCETVGDKLIVTPLPDGNDFTVRLLVDRANAVEAIDAKGSVVRAVPFKVEGRELTFAASKGDFAYRIQ